MQLNKVLKLLQSKGVEIPPCQCLTAIAAPFAAKARPPAELGIEGVAWPTARQRPFAGKAPTPLPKAHLH